MGAAGAQHTRDFDDVVAWLARQMAKTQLAGLLRIGCAATAAVAEGMALGFEDPGAGAPSSTGLWAWRLG